MLFGWTWLWGALAGAEVPATPGGGTPPVALEDGGPLVAEADGSVVIAVTVSADGLVTGVSLVRSSGDAEVDHRALLRGLQTPFLAGVDPGGDAAGAIVQLRIEVVDGTAPTDAEVPRDETPVLFDDIEEVLVVGEAETTVLQEQVVTVEDIRFLPGSGGDIVRSVQNLPGVARPPFNVGQLLVRGTSPDDSAYYLDGVPIPLVFHFGGLSTVLNADLLDDVRFLPGGYGARYGRRLGGVVDLRTTSTLPEGASGYASVDLFQGTVFGQARVGNSAFTLSARRSYIDTLLQPVIDANVEETVRAPRFWDLQARAMHLTPNGDRFDALLLVSDDAFRVLGEEEDEVIVNLGINFWKARLRWERDGPGPWRGEVSALFGPETQDFFVEPDGVALEDNFRTNLRAEIQRERQGDDPFGLLMGIEASTQDLTWEFDVPTFGNPDSGEASAVLGSAYAEVHAGIDAVEITTGVRGDVRRTDADVVSGIVDPRTIVTWHVDRNTDIEGSLGRYSQFPILRQIEPLESADLDPARSLDLTLGLERQLSMVWDVRLTGFYSQLSQLVVGRQDVFSFFTTPPLEGPLDAGAWDNDGTGTILGGEFQLRAQTSKTIGWVAATVSRSMRQDRPDEAPHLFAFDQPLNLVALLSHRLPKGWRLGSRLRFAVGTPYTEVLNTIDLQEDRTFVPVFGDELGARLAPFFALDVRFDKQWTFERWQMSVYVDVTNVTNNSNQELMSFSTNFQEERPVTGLPILPAFGLRADF